MIVAVLLAAALTVTAFVEDDTYKVTKLTVEKPIRVLGIGRL